MYAVIKTGGKQYRVAADDVITIEKLKGEVGEIIQFSDVLLLGGEGDAQIGAPLVDGASVAGEVLEQGRARKIIVFKKKRRKNYRRTHGHRQEQTTIRITEILTGGKQPSKAAAKKAEKPKAEKKAAKAEDSAPPKLSIEQLDGPNGEADDLKKISGVGPKLEQTLNNYGIYHYAQVAKLNKDDLVALDEALNFKGRIERDDWIGQAKGFMEEGAE